MKICVIHRYPISLIRGTNPSFPLFIDRLVSRGDEVYFISFKENDKQFIRADINNRYIDLEFNRANALEKLWKSLFFCFYVPFKVRRLNRSVNLDLVYCDDSFPLYSCLTRIIAGTKTVMRLGDLQSAYALYDRGVLGRVFFKIFLSFEKYLWKNVHRVVAISNPFKEFLIKEGLSEENIAVVEECIDLDMFRRNGSKKCIKKQYGLEDEPIIMFHGLIAKMKGLDTLVNAMPIVLKEIPRTKLMIIGDGPYLNNIKDLVRRLGLNHAVIFTGWLPFSDVPDYLAECHIGVPIRSSNLGNNFVITTALLQYWAMKKPVLAPRLPAISNIIKDGTNGVLFMPEDSEDLARKAIHYLKNPQLMQKTGLAGYETAKCRFNVDLISRQMVDTLCANSASSIGQQ